MRRLLSTFCFVLLLCSFGCEQEELGYDSTGKEDPTPDEGVEMFSPDCRIAAFSVDGSTTSVRYDTLGRVVARIRNGVVKETFSYGGGSVVFTAAGQSPLVLELDTMGYVASYKGQSYVYHKSGIQKGYVSSVTRYIYFNGALMPVVTRYEVSGTGLYNSYTVSCGSDVKTYKVLYGALPNYSDTFNPVLGEFGVTFLGRAPLKLPVRIECSDKSYRTFSYTFYPSGQVETWTEKFCKSDGTVFFERFSGADWSVNGFSYSGGAQLFQTLQKNVSSVLTDEAFTTFSYNSEGNLSQIHRSQDGLDESAEVIYEDRYTIQMGGQNGMLNDSGYLTRLGDCLFVYNEAGYLMRKTMHDESIFSEELYSYNADNCISQVLKRWKFSGDVAWRSCDSVRYEYVGVSGYMVKNLSSCIDVARGDFWNPFLGKNSPYLPVKEVNVDYSIDVFYDMNAYHYPEKITFLGASGLGQSDVVRIQWVVESNGMP